jgi:hypothetical protein
MRPISVSELKASKGRGKTRPQIYWLQIVGEPKPKIRLDTIEVEKQELQISLGNWHPVISLIQMGGVHRALIDVMNYVNMARRESRRKVARIKKGGSAALLSRFFRFRRGWIEVRPYAVSSYGSIG